MKNKFKYFIGTIKSNRLSTSAPKHNANPYNDRKTGELLNKRMSQNMSWLKNRVNKFPAIPLPSNNYRDRNNWKSVISNIRIGKIFAHSINC